MSEQSRSQFKRLQAQGAPDPERRRDEAAAPAIERFTVGLNGSAFFGMVRSFEGEFVRYTDHLAVLAAKRGEDEAVIAKLEIAAGYLDGIKSIDAYTRFGLSYVREAIAILQGER